MVYLVIEIQSTNDTAANIVNSYDVRSDAESKYHSILAAAAVSEVPVHTAVLITDTGKTLKNESYSHGGDN